MSAEQRNPAVAAFNAVSGSAYTNLDYVHELRERGSRVRWFDVGWNAALDNCEDAARNIKQLRMALQTSTDLLEKVRNSGVIYRSEQIEQIEINQMVLRVLEETKR